MSLHIDAHLRWLRAGGAATLTIEDRERLLRHVDQHTYSGLDDANAEDLADYLAYDGWSTWTRHTYDTHMRGYYAWAWNTGRRDDDPMQELMRTPEGERLPDPCTDAELADILERSPSYWRPVFILAAYAGLRRCEIAALKRYDVTETAIRVRRGKGGKAATIDTHPIVWDAVRDIPTERHVILNRRGRPMTAPGLGTTAQYLFRKLGMPRMRLHRLRHWHATALLEAGADLETVRQCMRHSSIISTVGYTLIGSRRRREAVHRLPVVGQIGHEPADIRLVPQTDTAA